MATRIDQTIIGWGVEDAKEANAASTAPEVDSPEADSPEANIIQMHERLVRPAALQGSTYKIKPPVCEHALYVTINDIVLNKGTPHEQRRPFEIFINSKNMEQFQWVVALTLIISAVFRKGGEFNFLVEELRSVFDPHGGYYKQGGDRKPSLVAEIGDVIEHHIQNIEQSEKLDFGAPPKRAEEKTAIKPSALANARFCAKCHTYKLIRSEGCDRCLNCGYSKCD